MSSDVHKQPRLFTLPRTRTAIGNKTIKRYVEFYSSVRVGIRRHDRNLLWVTGSALSDVS